MILFIDILLKGLQTAKKYTQISGTLEFHNQKYYNREWVCYAFSSLKHILNNHLNFIFQAATIAIILKQIAKFPHISSL